jgi:predicted permease
MRRFLLRLLNLVRRNRAEQELAREIAAHLQLLEDEFQRRGMSVAEARRAARIALGGVEQTKELQREARSFAWLDDARRDLAYGARVIRRNPVFAVTASLSLAIGIGANTAIFTVANALLFRDPPGVAEPGRLVDIGVSRGDGGINPTSYRTYLHIRERVTTLSGVYAQNLFPHAMSLGAGPVADRVFSQAVTTSYFSVLGAIPIAGRLFDASDSDQPGASAIAVLSYRFWNSRFAMQASVIGQTVRLNGRPFTIVGVAPEGFQGTGVVSPDVWLPLNGGSVVIGGRLKPGISMAQAAGELDALGRVLDREYPTGGARRELRLLPSSASPGNRRLIGRFLAIVVIIVTLVLAVACANVAGLLIARAASRQHEMAVRMAIGAGRARLVRQLITETMILFALGGGAGLLLARLMTPVLVPLLPSLPFPVMVPLTVDARVIAFTAVISLAAALLFGLAPALRTTKADVVTALKDDAQAPAGRLRLRTAFVIGQVAFSLVLVVTAGLFITALRRAGSTHPGFDPRGVELVSLDLSMGRYTDATGPRFWRELLQRVRQLPAVEAATIARVVPGGFEGIGLGGVTIPGVVPPDGALSFNYSWNIVEPGYFTTLRIPLVAGRDFTVDDTAASQPVAIVGEAAARQFWPDANALGKAFSFGAGGRGKTAVVVGIVGDVRSSSLIDGLAGSFIYLPLQQHYESRMTSMMTIAARGVRDQRVAGDIRALVASMDPSLAMSASTLEDSTALGLAPQRIAMSVSGTLGIIGLLLAAIGIYGVTAYTVARRSREIGIRIALGARRSDIMRLVLGQGLMLTTVGSGIGLLLAAGVSQLLVFFLFGVPPMHPPTFLTAALVFGGVGFFACYLPARRATTVDPLRALRRE